MICVSKECHQKTSFVFRSAECQGSSFLLNYPSKFGMEVVVALEKEHGVHDDELVFGAYC